MAIYKQVMPGHNNNERAKQVTSNQSNASMQMEDETFEYFSDKEEAEKHRKTKEQKPRRL